MARLELRSDALDSLERFVQTALEQLQEGGEEPPARAILNNVTGILGAFPAWRRSENSSASLPIRPPRHDEEVAEWIDRTYGWTGSRGYKGATRRPIL